MKQDTWRNDVAEIAFDPATGIASLTLAMEGRANKINEIFTDGLTEAVARLYTAYEGLKGVILGTAHKDFCVGADLDVMFRERDPARVVEGIARLGGVFRKLETGGVPVVCALTGSALGGGYELALACHHRIALDDGRIMLGLPEVSMGLIPGGGGTQRLPRRVGLQAALELILQGRIVRAPKAVEAGLVEALAPDREALRAAAEAWIAANPGAKQPWDDKRFRWPGARPGSADAQGLFMGAAAMLYKKTAGAVPAPEAALCAVHEGSLVGFDAAMLIEGRYFAKVATSDTAKDMIRTFWYHRNAVEKGEGLPPAIDPGVRKAAILGAGMMGAGLAWLAAKAGWDVVVRDISEEALAKGRAHAEQQTARAMKHKAEAERAALLGRITWTLDVADLAGADLVIEAIVENGDVKHRVTREVEPHLAPDALFASNTSAIPITWLAEASRAPERFIGLHFFSPVEQMPLLEIILGKATDERTLQRCLSVARALGKLPIVVNDGYGFFTSRVFGAYLMEGVQLVAEGHDPVLVEWAAKAAGMAVAPLQVFDEVSLRLGSHASSMRKRFLGDEPETDGQRLIGRLLALDRGGKAEGKGFYSYEGRERRLWPGLRELVDATPAETGVEYLKDRLMYAQIAEVGRTLDEGVLRQYRDAEVGAIFGIGFAPATGGPLAWMDRRGLPRVVADLDRLTDAVGERYRPAPALVAMASRGERFFEAV